MDDDQREIAINKAKIRLEDSYQSRDLDAARWWALKMIRLIQGRSIEVLYRMERQLGLR